MEVFFHGIYPTPICDGPTCQRRQMKEVGNMSLHSLAFKCPGCHQLLVITIQTKTGETWEDVGCAPDIEAIDSTP